MRFYIEVLEDRHILSVGQRGGYETVTEAKADALRHVDDMMPRNTVRIMMLIGTAFLDAEGAAAWQSDVEGLVSP